MSDDIKATISQMRNLPWCSTKLGIQTCTIDSGSSSHISKGESLFNQVKNAN